MNTTQTKPAADRAPKVVQISNSVEIVTRHAIVLSSGTIRRTFGYLDMESAKKAARDFRDMGRPVSLKWETTTEECSTEYAMEMRDS